jgi:hypothetical protein
VLLTLLECYVVSGGLCARSFSILRRLSKAVGAANAVDAAGLQPNMTQNGEAP